MRNFDAEAAGAPSERSFIAAFVTKYGILGAVILFLGYMQVTKDSQVQDQNKALMALVEKNATAATTQAEINRRMIDYLERNERTGRAARE
jgi:hypothetical protein